MAEDHVFATMRIVLLGVLAVIPFGLGLPPLVRYGGSAPAFAAMVLVTAVSAVWVLRRRPLPIPVVVAGVAVVLVASWAATAALPPGGHFREPHWSFGQVGWYLLLLLLDRTAVLIAAFAVHVAASTAQFVAAGAPDRVAIGVAGTVVLSTTAFQLAVLVITRVLRRSARQAAEVAAQRDRAATRAELARQWERDQRLSFAGQLGAVLPLLAGMADGVLDPRDEATRLRCATAATQLRRLFAENDDVPDPLAHEVSACADVAERRGVAVSLAISGAAVEVPADVRRELTGPLVAALSAARSRARVSLLRTEREVRVAVVADAGVEVAPVSGRVEVECGAYGEHTRMEARWRSGNR